MLNHWRALAGVNFQPHLLKSDHTPDLTLMEELLDQVDGKQANLRAVKQLQMCCLNCYLTCKESLLAHEAEEGE